MEGRLSGIPRRVGGRSSSAGHDGSSFAPATSHGNAPGSSRSSRPMSKLSLAEPGKKTNTGRRSKSGSGCPVTMLPTTPLYRKAVIPFSLSETPATGHRNRTPSAERMRYWKGNLERALACKTVKDRRPITDAAWQRAQLNRLQAYFVERAEACDPLGVVQPVIQRPLAIARFVDLVNQLLAPIINSNEINVKNYVIKLPLVVKKLLYPGVISKSWLQTVNTSHSFPHALGLMSYLMDLNRTIEEENDDWLFSQCDEVSYLKHMYLRKTWENFQDDKDYEVVTEEYIEQLMTVLDVSVERKEKLENDIKAMQERLSSPGLLTARGVEQQKVAAVARVKAALRDADAECASQRSLISTTEESIVEMQSNLELIIDDIANLKEKQEKLKEILQSQTMTVKERNKLLDDVDYSNRVMDSKLAMIAGLEKKLYELNINLSCAQKDTMGYCIEFNEKLISLDNVDERTIQVNQFIIEERELVEPSAISKVDNVCEWLDNRKREIAETIKRIEADKLADTQRKSSVVEEIKKLTKQLVQTRQAKTTAENEWRKRRNRHGEEVESLKLAIASTRRRAQSRAEEANAIRVKEDKELEHLREEVRLWNDKLTNLKVQAEKRKAFLGKLSENAKQTRKTKLLSMFDSWKQMLPKK